MRRRHPACKRHHRRDVRHRLQHRQKQRLLRVLHLQRINHQSVMRRNQFRHAHRRHPAERIKQILVQHLRQPVHAHRRVPRAIVQRHRVDERAVEIKDVSGEVAGRNVELHKPTSPPTFGPSRNRKPHAYSRRFQRSATETNAISAGTSTNGPTTAAKVAPEVSPKTPTATAMANSKLLPAAVNPSVAAFE